MLPDGRLRKIPLLLLCSDHQGYSRCIALIATVQASWKGVGVGGVFRRDNTFVMQKQMRQTGLNFSAIGSASMLGHPFITAARADHDDPGSHVAFEHLLSCPENTYIILQFLLYLLLLTSIPDNS